MNKLSALMIGAAMVLGTAFAAQNAPKANGKVDHYDQEGQEASHENQEERETGR